MFNQSLAGQFSSNLDAIQGSQTLRIKVQLLYHYGDAPILATDWGDLVKRSMKRSYPMLNFIHHLLFGFNLQWNSLSSCGAWVIGFLLIAVPLIYMATGMMRLSGHNLFIFSLCFSLSAYTIVEFLLYSGLHWLLLGLIIVWGLNFESGVSCQRIHFISITTLHSIISALGLVTAVFCRSDGLPLSSLSSYQWLR